MKSFLQRQIEQLRSYGLVATLGELSQFGPLGRAKTRRQLGKSFDLLPPEVALGTSQNQERPTLVEAGADNHDELSIGDALSQQVVVTCTLDFPNAAERDPLTRICNVIGTLSWGADGHSQSVDFDFRHGTVLRPVGSSFRVSARLAPDILGNQPNTMARVGAFIGYGGAHGPWGCTSTRRVGLPGSVAVPPLATYLTLYWPEDAVTVQWFAGPNLVQSFELGAGSAGQKLPVPGGGVTRVQFTDAVGTAVAVWSLEL